MPERQFPVHRDERGELIVVEGAELDFAVRRVFTVTGADGSVPRGGHRADCTELVVLVAGAVTITLQRPSGDRVLRALDEPGASVTIAAGDYVVYELDGARSAIVVLCDAPYRSPA